MAQQQLEGPGERRRRRLVAGDEQRHQLVAQLLVGERAALLVASLEQDRQHVVALLDVGGTAAAGDLVVDLGIGRGPQAQEALPDVAADRAADLGQRDHRERAALHADIEHRRESLAQPREPVGVVDAEDGPHDDLQRDLLRSRPQSERLAHRPARDLLLRDLAHHVAVALHALTVEGREHQLALAHVLAAVEQQHGVAAHQRLQRCRVRLAGVEGVRIAREDLLDHGRVGDEHDRADRGSGR